MGCLRFGSGNLRIGCGYLERSDSGYLRVMKSGSAILSAPDAVIDRKTMDSGRHRKGNDKFHSTLNAEWPPWRTAHMFYSS